MLKTEDEKKTQCNLIEQKNYAKMRKDHWQIISDEILLTYYN